MMLNEFLYRKDDRSKAYRKKGTKIKNILIPIFVVFRPWSIKTHTRRVAHIDICQPTATVSRKLKLISVICLKDATKYR